VRIQIVVAPVVVRSEATVTASAHEETLLKVGDIRGDRVELRAGTRIEGSVLYALIRPRVR
jgi:hypothetical protein